MQADSLTAQVRAIEADMALIIDPATADAVLQAALELTEGVTN